MSIDNKGAWASSFWFLAYEVAGIATFIYLTFFDGYEYTNWNWIIAIPVNAFLSQIWPIYWLILQWFA